MEDHSKDNKYMRAKEKVERLRKFYTSLTAYLFVMALLAGINYYFNGLSYPWFLWAAFGWGIGLLFQAAKAFEWNPVASKDWEERKIREFMEREERNEKGMGRWE
ncbi:MAG: histidine kinase [Cytophagaceae bacterium]|nr:histidine kinase [Cytophagaceae bacterium]|tara:strand:- start:65 stop:379 length:315 start_codon:yes stop_codon:yes gene_type:complete